jgi:Rrf2 family protein
MIGLSHTTGYAIQALSCLENSACGCRSIADVAKCSSVPRQYLAKIGGALARAGIVIAKRGVGGGISLARPASEISLLQIVEAIEGSAWLSECLLGLDPDACQRMCPTHDFWKRICREITAELNGTSLADLIHSRSRGRNLLRPGRGDVLRQ